MGMADNHIHPPDTDGQRIARKQAAAIERLYVSAFNQAKFAQAAAFGFTEPMPVNAKDDGTGAEREGIKGLRH